MTAATATSDSGALMTKRVPEFTLADLIEDLDACQMQGTVFLDIGGSPRLAGADPDDPYEVHCEQTTGAISIHDLFERCILSASERHDDEWLAEANATALFARDSHGQVLRVSGTTYLDGDLLL